MDLTLPHHFSSGLDERLGLVITELSAGYARGQAPVSDALMQPTGLVHGGVYAAIAESLASLGTLVAVTDTGRTAVGLSNHTSFMRPITEGTVHGTARARHRGRTTWLWEVDLCDDAGRLCAASRVTIAVRDVPDR